MDAINSSGVDTLLTIYNSDKVLITQNDDSGSGLNSLASVSVIAGNDYYIKATVLGSGTGAYQVSATAITLISGSSFETAIDLTTTTPISGKISIAGEADYYKYRAYATGGINFATRDNGNSNADTYIRIYDSSRNLIAEDDDSGLGLNSLVNVSVVSGNDYYIKVTYRSGTEDFKVSASVRDIVRDDVGNLLDTSATLLSFTSNIATQNRRIDSATDIDVFRFTADVEGVYEIEVAATKGLTLPPVIEVIGRDGTTLLEFSSANAGDSAFALPLLTVGQQVYIRVLGAGLTGDYRLQVTKPADFTDYYANVFNPTSSPSVGVIILSSGTNSGSLTNAQMVIESATDVDVFSFTTNRSGPIQVSVSKAVGSNLDTIISILDASGNVIASNDNSGTSTDSSVVFQVSKKGVYYIQVKGYFGTIGQFDISVTDLTPTVAENDGAGTDLTNATTLSVGVPSTGNISSAGDQDFFTFTALSPGVLTISLAAGAISGLDTYLYLYNSDKVLILGDDNTGSGSNSLISINVLTGKTYYLQASGNGSSTGAYTISASISAADDHANQAGESATRLIVSSTNAVSNTAGTINPSTDNDVFLYKATADGSITINVTPTNNSALNSYLFVYDSTGNILLAYNDGNSSTDRTSIISLQVVRDAVYYFMVSGAAGTTGAYNISVTPVTDIVGNTIALATNLPISTTATPNTTVGTVNGSIGSNGDLDFYKVAINRSGRYAFRASANPTSNGLDTTIAVYSENGQLLGENDDASASSLNSSLSLNLNAGEIVYVRVAGYGQSTGDYIFNVVYLSSLITAPVDDFGGTINDAYSFPLDNTHSYTTSSANIQFAGDADVFHGVADLTGNITLVLTPSANLQGNIRAFVHRNGENIQVGSVNGSALGGVVNLTFPVSASENFYIEISGNNGTTDTYRLSVNNVIATNTARPTADSVIDRIAEELREEFTRIIAAASATADINATSSVIMTQLLAVIQRLIPGFSGLVGFFDPVDINLTGGGGTIGSQGSNSTNSNPSASLSSRGALDLVVIPGAAAGQYNLNMAGVASGTVHAGVAMVGANGQVITPTITGGQSSG
ncbi:MAG: PPC domain-containing protein, partial [Planctomycetota bacterium]|nr:PPC domain-containing protein [Planctomycetota bacterium]